MAFAELAQERPFQKAGRSISSIHGGTTFEVVRILGTSRFTKTQAGPYALGVSGAAKAIMPEEELAQKGASR